MEASSTTLFGDAVACQDLNRLHPGHDTVRDADARLRAFVDDPDDSLRVSGFLLGLHDLLATHLDDEWRTLVPLFAGADASGIARLQERFPAGLDRPRSSATRSYLPTPYERFVRHTGRRDLRTVEEHLARAARTAVQRAAASEALPLSEDLGLRLDLRPVVSSPRITLLVGRLASSEPEPLLAPVDLEVTATPGGQAGEWTLLELTHTPTSEHVLPADAPGHRLAAIAIHAIAGEWAFTQR